MLCKTAIRKMRDIRYNSLDSQPNGNVYSALYEKQCTVRPGIIQAGARVPTPEDQNAQTGGPRFGYHLRLVRTSTPISCPAAKHVWMPPPRRVAICV